VTSPGKTRDRSGPVGVQCQRVIRSIDHWPAGAAPRILSMLGYEQGITAGVEQGPNAGEGRLDVTAGGREGVAEQEQVIDTPLFVIAATRR
jgi:hypothetical protein